MTYDSADCAKSAQTVISDEQLVTEDAQWVNTRKVQACKPPALV
jgi:hypothetical protein